MAFKSTSIAMTTTPQLIVGPGGVIDTTLCFFDDPVYYFLVLSGGNAIYFQGSSAALGAAPTVFALSTVVNSPQGTLIGIATSPSDSLFAGTTVAGGSLLVCGFRQQAS